MCDGGEALALAADIAHIIKAIQLRSKLNYIPCSGVSESSVYILCVDYTHIRMQVYILTKILRAAQRWNAMTKSTAAASSSASQRRFYASARAGDLYKYAAHVPDSFGNWKCEMGTKRNGRYAPKGSLKQCRWKCNKWW